MTLAINILLWLTVGTLAFIAAMRSRPLLEGGARVDDRDVRGRTALMIAAEGGHAEIAALLLARGADPSLMDNAGRRAADLAVPSALRERLSVR